MSNPAPLSRTKNTAFPSSAVLCSDLDFRLLTPRRILDGVGQQMGPHERNNSGSPLAAGSAPISSEASGARLPGPSWLRAFLDQSRHGPQDAAAAVAPNTG